MEFGFNAQFINEIRDMGYPFISMKIDYSKRTCWFGYIATPK